MRTPALLMLLIVFGGWRPLWAESCALAHQPEFDRLIAQRGDAEAMRLILGDLGATPEEEARFHLEPGLWRKNGERPAQSRPETRSVAVDPGLISYEGHSVACQGLAHELAHLRHFDRDWKLLQARYPEMSKEDLTDRFDSLLDNDLSTHAAAYEIEAVLAQRSASADGTLPEEDFEYLVENLKRFSKNLAMINRSSNAAYYLPEIKREDVRLYRQGCDYVLAARGIKIR